MAAEAASWAITSSLIGYIVGSFLDSRLNDRFGRKVALYLSVSLFAFGSLFSATSPSLGWLIFWRVISGMGIGAEIAAVTTYMGELSPASLRGRCTGWAISAGFLGFAVVPFAALALVPNYTWGWRALFVIGAIGGIVLLFMRRHIPQSPHWLLNRGRMEEAQATLVQAESLAEQKLGSLLPAVPESKQAIQEPKGRFIDLFRPPYLGRLILFAVIATGISVTDGLGHLGGAFCGQIVFAVYHPYGFSGAFVAMAATGFIAAVLLCFGIKATGRSLHHL